MGTQNSSDPFSVRPSGDQPLAEADKSGLDRLFEQTDRDIQTAKRELDPLQRRDNKRATGEKEFSTTKPRPPVADESSKDATTQQASNEELEILRERVQIAEVQFKQNDEQYRKGMRGGSKDRREVAAYELALAQANLATAEGKHDEALTKLIDCQSHAEEAFKAVVASYDAGRVSYDYLRTEANRLAEIKLKLARLKREKSQSQPSPGSDAGQLRWQDFTPKPGDQGSSPTKPRPVVAGTNPELAPLLFVLKPGPSGKTEIFLNGKPTDEGAVRKLLGQSQKSTDLEFASVTADREVGFSDVIKFIDLLESLGVKRLALDRNPRETASSTAKQQSSAKNEKSSPQRADAPKPTISHQPSAAVTTPYTFPGLLALPGETKQPPLPTSPQEFSKMQAERVQQLIQIAQAAPPNEPYQSANGQPAANSHELKPQDATAWGAEPATANQQANLRPHRQNVYAQVDGIIKNVNVEHDDVVHKGDVLLVLESPDLDKEIERIRGQLQKDLAAVRSTTQELDRNKELSAVEKSKKEIAVAQLKESINSSEKQLTLLKEMLKITSPIDGRVVTSNVKDRLAFRPVNRGENLLEIAEAADKPVSQLLAYKPETAKASPNDLIFIAYHIPEDLKIRPQKFMSRSQIRNMEDERGRYIVQASREWHDRFASLLKATPKWQESAAAKGGEAGEIQVRKIDGEDVLDWQSVGLTLKRNTHPDPQVRDRSGGVAVSEVAPGSPAAWNNIQPGDIAITIGEFEIDSVSNLASLLKTMGEGFQKGIVVHAVFFHADPGTRGYNFQTQFTLGPETVAPKATENKDAPQVELKAKNPTTVQETVPPAAPCFN